jgi:hypothetical protein
MAAWTAPSGTTRGGIFQRVAALAGIEVGEASGDRAPSTAWSTDTPAFAIAINERGSTTLRRLLEVTPDFIRPSFGTGGLEVCGFTDSTYHQDYYYLHGQQFSTMPAIAFSTSDELAPNWTRLQGPDRYADDFDELVDDYTDILALGPMGFSLRDQDAGTDGKAGDRAANARKRAAQLVPRGQLTSPAHVGQELFDILRIRNNVDDPGTNVTAYYRVVGIALDYRTGPAGRAAYTTTFDLADYQVFS